MFEKHIKRSDMLSCVLCSHAPCSEACGRIDCASMLRSIWFDNEKRQLPVFLRSIRAVRVLRRVKTRACGMAAYPSVS